jgi:hypothetical protein
MPQIASNHLNRYGHPGSPLPWPTTPTPLAGRLMLRELNRLVHGKAEFAFESTLSGLRYATA